MDDRKKLGVVGGMGSVAAAYFFNRLVELTPAKTDQQYIETFVHNNSSVPDRTDGILYGGESPLPELRRSVSILNEMGADYIVMACMTSHYFIEDLQRESRAIIIDGIKETAHSLRQDYGNIKRAGILASTGAIKLGLFQKALADLNMEGIVLNDEEQFLYFTEPIYHQEWGIKTGCVDGKSKERLFQGVEALSRTGAQVVIAGCSELPLIFRGESLSVPVVDSIDVLLEKAIKLCLGLDQSLRLRV